MYIADTADQTAGDALGKNVFEAFGTAVKDDSLVPYLDYATPTMADTLGAALQDLLAKKATPDKFLDTVEKDYSGFVASNARRMQALTPCLAVLSLDTDHAPQLSAPDALTALLLGAVAAHARTV